MRRAGFVVGYAGEARLLPPGTPVRCSGADAGRAHKAARTLIREGAAGLVSFGVAGALAPDLAAGVLLLPEAVVDLEGRRYPGDVAWRQRVRAHLKASRICPSAGLLAGAGNVAATPDVKRRLFERTGALAVDMESAAVARAARAHGLPFIALRAIADTALDDVPQAALVALNQNGRVRPLSVLLELARRPADLGSLLRLQRRTRLALGVLRAALAAAGPALLVPPPA